MANKDFQNGFALGLVSGGVNDTKQIKCEGKVEVIIPKDISGNVTINSNSIFANSTVEIGEK